MRLSVSGEEVDLAQLSGAAARDFQHRLGNVRAHGATGLSDPSAKRQGGLATSAPDIEHLLAWPQGEGVHDGSA